MEGNPNMHKTKILCITVSILLIGSIGLNLCQFFCKEEFQPLDWLQTEEFVDQTIRGVLVNSEAFREGDDLSIAYDLENAAYDRLLEQYHLAETAGDGSEFSKAKNLMQAYSGRIRHSSSVAVSDENMNAEYLLEHYLDSKEGTYCRAKAQILNEMCLSLGICSRKLWIIPLSIYDKECHVVNEVWDSAYNKWIMLDISNNLYWVDENAEPLSMLEVRDRMIHDRFCTPVSEDDDLKDLEKARKDHEFYYAYYAKNLAVLKYMDMYTVGETQGCYLLPVNYALKSDVKLISREAVERKPFA